MDLETLNHLKKIEEKIDSLIESISEQNKSTPEQNKNQLHFSWFDDVKQLLKFKE